MQKIVFIVGPTAIGKSDIAVHLAAALNGEIVSCDAMQVYREVTIASNKPSRDQCHLVAHHLLDVISVTEEFNVAQYAEMARKVIDDIIGRGKVPLVVGGSGLYMQILLDGIFQDESQGQGLRKSIQEEGERQGWDRLYQKLKECDPQAASKIHPHDKRRLVRALEVYRSKGKPLSSLHNKRQGIWGHFDIAFYGLHTQREYLYEKINKRVDVMFERGLENEVRLLQDISLSRTACGLIGIQEVRGYLHGDYDLERAKYLMKRNTRHLAKRQLTWFRREKRLVWIEVREQERAKDVARRILADMKSPGREK